MSFSFFEDEASRDGETGEIDFFLPENDVTICAEATVRNSRKSARCQFYYGKMTPIQNENTARFCIWEIDPSNGEK